MNMELLGSMFRFGYLAFYGVNVIIGIHQ